MRDHVIHRAPEVAGSDPGMTDGTPRATENTIVGTGGGRPDGTATAPSARPDGAPEAAAPHRATDRPWDRGLARLRGVWLRLPAHWRFAIVAFITTKLVLTVVGIFAYHAFDSFWARLPGRITRPGDGNPFEISHHRWISMWYVWDSYLYNQLIHGPITSPGNKPSLQYAFPPLYPALARIVALPLGPQHAALALLIVSDVALLFLLTYAYRLGVHLFGSEAEGRTFTRYLLLLPAAFLFQAALTESLFLCLTLACFYYAERRRWLLVGVLGFFLALTRSLGFLIAIPLALILLQQGGYRLRPAALWRYIRDGWPLLLLPAGWLSFMAYCGIRTGDWYKYQHIQEHDWSITPVNPITYVWTGLRAPVSADRLRVWFALICLALIVVSVRRIRPAYLVYALICIAVPMTISGPGAYRSLIRYLVVVFPLAMIFTRWVRRRPAIDPYLTAGLALLQGVLFVLWLNPWVNFIV